MVLKFFRFWTLLRLSNPKVPMKVTKNRRNFLFKNRDIFAAGHCFMPNKKLQLKTNSIQEIYNTKVKVNSKLALPANSWNNFIFFTVLHTHTHISKVFTTWVPKVAS